MSGISGGGVTQLSQLTDVQLTSIADGDVIRRVANDVKWENEPGFFANPMVAGGDTLYGYNGSDFARGIVPTADFGPTNGANLTDGNDATIGTSGRASNGTWFALDLGVPIAVASMRIVQWPPNTGGSGSPTGAVTYVLEGSTDNATWNPVFTQPSAETSGTHSFNLITYRYWRLRCLTATTDGNWGVYTWSLFGGVNGTPVRLPVGSTSQVLTVVGGVPAWVSPAAGSTLGTLGYAQVTANQGGITTRTDLTGLSVTVTVGAGRRIRITGRCRFESSVNTDQAQMDISEGSTVLDNYQSELGATAGRADYFGQVVLTPSTGSHTYKLQGERNTGAGTLQMDAGSANPAYILVEDIGT